MASEDPYEALVQSAITKIGSIAQEEVRSVTDTLRQHVNYYHQQWVIEKRKREELKRHFKDIKEESARELASKDHECQVFLAKVQSALQTDYTQLNEKRRELSVREACLKEREEILAANIKKAIEGGTELDVALLTTIYHDIQHEQQKHHPHVDHTTSVKEDTSSSLSVSMDLSCQQQQPAQSRGRSNSMTRNPRPNGLKPNSKVYGEIRPGCITHEDIQRQFTDYFTKYRRRYGSEIVAYNKQKGAIPCQVLQIAYDQCVEKVCSIVNNTLETQNTEDVIKARKMLRDSHLSSSMTPLSTELIVTQLRSLFLKPIEWKPIDTAPVTSDNWEERKYAFALLLNSSKIKTNDILKALKEKIPKHNVTGIKNDDIFEMLDKAIELSWNMVTLVPPAIVYQPYDYLEEWQDRRYTCWKEAASNNKLIHFRPVLFFSTLGHVGCKGEIGNIPPSGTSASNPTTNELKFKSPLKVKESLTSPSSGTTSHSKEKKRTSTKKPCMNGQLEKSVGITPSNPSINTTGHCFMCQRTCTTTGICPECMK